MRPQRHGAGKLFKASCGALLALAFLLSPALEALGHDHATGAGAVVIHTEASHPTAAPHLEQEEHREPEDCLVCLHSGKTYLGQPYAMPAPICLDAGEPSPCATPAAKRARASSSPRGPPV